ncbi:Vitronectin [Pelobates cultripes]|uniref:Vitronectin n=1 Tax=Pelobates cultripes TaxID=61616 RepID=A0AAD1QY76_PELCU|nr:Vitronectin [Pelobates cultripes]
MGALHLLAVLLLGALGLSLAAEESCEGYCFHGFNANRKCQCDYMCPYYESCCSDYETVCKPIEKRGDVFVVPEDGDYEENINDFNYTTNAFSENLSVDEVPSPASSTLATTTLNEKITETITDRIAEVPDVPDVPDIPDELCSGKPFDAFTNVKNGSIYAFRGKYFYELNDSKALEGYPKRIKDVWGIEGPIDAAFTRINCQGKTYIFKDDVCHLSGAEDRHGKMEVIGRDEAEQ